MAPNNPYYISGGSTNQTSTITLTTAYATSAIPGVASQTSSASGPGDTAKPYTYGLNGVNVSEDNLSSHLLYGTIALMFLAIFAIRITRKLNAHLRHLTSMGSLLEQDKFWSQERGTWWPALKTDLIYAPLWKKRHNREVQLSKAVNVGTLPGRLHAIILVAYLVSNIIYCMLLDYTVLDKAALYADIRGRTGHLSVVNCVGLFVIAGRNNPLIPILGVSFDTFNLFHRWIGRIVILEAVAHTIAWSVGENMASGQSGIAHAFQTQPFLQWGLAGTLALSIIFVQAPSAIRHAAYETFLHVHQFLAFVSLLAIYFHANLGNLPQMPYVIAIIIFWFYDRIFRVARLIYYNFSFTEGITKATVVALSGDACRVTFFLPRPWAYTPGTHAYIYFPSISGHMSHPFSIAWSSTAARPPFPDLEEKLPMTTSDLSLPCRQVQSISFLMAKRTGMTAKLYDLANAKPSKTLYINGFLEGPYGAPQSLHSYGTVVLFAGGVGITHQIGQIRHLLSAHDAGTTATRRITLVWTVRTTEQLDWVRPWMNELLNMPGRREILNLQMFVTKPLTQTQVRSASDSVKMFPGRPNTKEIIAQEYRNRIGAMVVGICGPGAFADDIRAGVRALPKDGVVDFWEEAFTW